MSTRSDSMQEVVAVVAPDLKAAGFRKRRHSFNRTTAPGVVQVVDFQMAAYRVPPGSPVPPGLVDGSFTVNLGVYLQDPGLPWLDGLVTEQDVSDHLEHEERLFAQASSLVSSRVDLFDLDRDTRNRVLEEMADLRRRSLRRDQ